MEDGLDLLVTEAVCLVNDIFPEGESEKVVVTVPLDVTLAESVKVGDDDRVRDVDFSSVFDNVTLCDWERDADDDFVGDEVMVTDEVSDQESLLLDDGDGVRDVDSDVVSEGVTVIDTDDERDALNESLNDSDDDTVSETLRDTSRDSLAEKLNVCSSVTDLVGE